MCEVEYADFVVCTFPEEKKLVIHIERIMADPEFWSQYVKKPTKFLLFVSFLNFLEDGTQDLKFPLVVLHNHQSLQVNHFLKVPVYQNHKQKVLQRSTVFVKILKMMEMR